MSPANMPRLAQRLGINIEQLGLPPALAGFRNRSARMNDGLLLFDADAISLRPEHPEAFVHPGLSR